MYYALQGVLPAVKLLHLRGCNLVSDPARLHLLSEVKGQQWLGIYETRCNLNKGATVGFEPMLFHVLYNIII